MNRSHARKLADSITNEQLQQMFDLAKEKITDWTKVSKVNKGMTKGLAWNVLAKNFDINAKHHVLAKTNMIREFWEFLPDELKPKKVIKETRKPVHQEPIFDNDL